MPEIRTHHLHLATGPVLDIAETGDPQGVPVVLLHGYSDSRRSFEPLMVALPAWVRAIAVSQRGHGDSDRPASGYRVADFAADVVAVLDALDLPQAVLVGHSMGSLVAQRAALDDPARVAGLVLVGAFASLADNAAVAELWRDAVEPMRDPVDPGFVRAFQESTLAAPVPADFLDLVVAESLKLPARIWRDTLAGLMAADFRAEIRGLPVAALILWGERDSFGSRAEQMALAEALPVSRFAGFPGLGHAPHWEAPARMAEAIARFAAELAPGLARPALAARR